MNAAIRQTGAALMKVVGLLTKEDVVEIFQEELRELMNGMRAQLAADVKAAVTEALASDLPRPLDEALDQGLKDLREKVIEGLRDAVRQVLEEGPYPALGYPADDDNR
jgi:hypothetical protein